MLLKDVGQTQLTEQIKMHAFNEKYLQRKNLSEKSKETTNSTQILCRSFKTVFWPLG